MNVLRAIYKYWTAIVFVAVLVQIGAAGYGAFYTANKLEDKGDVLGHRGYEHGWDFHGGFGTLVVGGMIVLLLLGLASRLGRPRIWWPLALAVAGVVQILLAELGKSVPALGFLHPLNALVIFALSGLLAHRAWRATATPA